MGQLKKANKREKRIDYLSKNISHLLQSRSQKAIDPHMLTMAYFGCHAGSILRNGLSLR